MRGPCTFGSTGAADIELSVPNAEGNETSAQDVWRTVRGTIYPLCSTNVRGGAQAPRLSSAIREDSQRLQEFDQVVDVPLRQVQSEVLSVVLDHRSQVAEPAVVVEAGAARRRVSVLHTRP